jgi:HSP20 family molecular chaperone IbpA
MVLHKRIVALPGARRPLTQPLGRLASRPTSRTGGALLLSVLLVSPAWCDGDPGATPDARDRGRTSATLSVSVSETPDAVRLRIQASGEVEPGSVEIRFGHRKAVVLARDAEGRPIRSRSLRLPAPVVEDGASADYDDQDALVMTLPKQATAQVPAPAGDPEAAVR